MINKEKKPAFTAMPFYQSCARNPMNFLRTEADVKAYVMVFHKYIDQKRENKDEQSVQVKLCGQCWRLYLDNKAKNALSHGRTLKFTLGQVFGKRLNTIENSYRYFTEVFLIENYAGLSSEHMIEAAATTYQDSRIVPFRPFIMANDYACQVPDKNAMIFDDLMSRNHQKAVNDLVKRVDRHQSLKRSSNEYMR